MKLELKPEGTYKYDAVSLGEVMLRLDPGEGRIRTAAVSAQHALSAHGKAAASTTSSAAFTSASA